MRKILRQLCEWEKVTIVEAEVCPDHSWQWETSKPVYGRQVTSPMQMSDRTNAA